MTFVDTSYLVALLDENDKLHAQAVDVARQLRKKAHRVVTTDAVLFELGNYFAKSRLRAEAVQVVRELRRSKAAQVVMLSSALFSRAETRYIAHPDKTWSLTDCYSMEVMVELGLREAATHDHHFEQAGFRILL